MTRTRIYQKHTHLIIAFAIVLASVFAFTSHAQARGGGTGPSKFESDCSSGGRGATSPSKFTNADCSSEFTSKSGKGVSGTVPRESNRETKIQELESRRADLMNRFRLLTGSSTNEDTSGEWKSRFCKGEGKPGAGSANVTVSLSPEVRDRVCGHWDKSSTTPNTKPPKASSTPMVKVHQPNGGVRYKHRQDGAILISWRNTTSDTTVDIDLKSGSTTTSIAKDVVGKKPRESQNRGKGKYDSTSSEVLGASTRAGDDYGHGHKDSKMNKGKSQPVLTYRYVNAQEGEGYKIVITAKQGDVTYTDESDNTFSIKKMKNGMKWQDDVTEEGTVLGASTSNAQEVLSALEADLVLMLAQMSS